MNLYLRYFNDETLVSSVDEAIEFLSSIPDLQIDDALVSDLKQFSESNVSYPKRYKVRPRVYFIVIKTIAASLDEFKANKRSEEASDSMMLESNDDHMAGKKEFRTTFLSEENPGWYDGTILFKRVIPIPGTNKFQYKDTRFRAHVKARSGLDCYNRIIEHLKNRQDVDLRSQFPSAKGRNFSCVYLGEKRA